jgi:hypothetical protein
VPEACLTLQIRWRERSTSPTLQRSNAPTLQKRSSAETGPETIVTNSTPRTWARSHDDIAPFISPYLKEAECLWNLLRRLQLHLLETPFPDLPIPLFSFVETISARTTLEIALTVDRVIQNILASIPAHITAIRVSEIYSFGDSDVCWQVIEWRENNSEEIIAVFQIDDAGPPECGCSWLMLSSPPPIERCKGDPQATMTLSWNVLDMTTLNTLFWAVQHGLGILEMPKADATKIYCRNKTNSPFEEFKFLFLRF